MFFLTLRFFGDDKTDNRDDEPTRHSLGGTQENYEAITVSGCQPQSAIARNIKNCNVIYVTKSNYI
jgi:hypothetical protein